MKNKAILPNSRRDARARAKLTVYDLFLAHDLFLDTQFDGLVSVQAQIPFTEGGGHHLFVCPSPDLTTTWPGPVLTQKESASQSVLLPPTAFCSPRPGHSSGKIPCRRPGQQD